MNEMKSRDEFRRVGRGLAFWATCFGINLSAILFAALDSRWFTAAFAVLIAVVSFLTVWAIVRGMGVLRVSIIDYLPLLSERALQSIAAECDEIVARRRDERNQRAVDEMLRDGGDPS